MEALENLRITATTKSEQAVAGLEALATTLERLKVSVTGLEKGATAVRRIANAGKTMGTVVLGVEQFVDGMNRVKVATTGLDANAQGVRNLATAGRALSKVRFAQTAGAMGRVREHMNGIFASGGRMNSSLAATAVKIWAVYRVLRLVANALAKIIELSNNFIEMMNLFSVAMGQYAKGAYEYAQLVSETLGIDPAQWMEQQAALMEIIGGYGIASDKAAIMSQQLTQLGYDLASLWNTDVESAFAKIQSGITGQTRAVRAWGFDISAVTLAQTAERLGLEKSYDAMSQAEKAYLRYYVLMTQITNMHGDMAKTINAPANQLRVLKAQLTQAGRAIGDLFIPMLNKVLPYVIAFAKAVRLLAQQLATLLGIELPSVSWDTYTALESVDDEFADMSESIDGATGSAQKLKKTLLGIDEINMLNAPNESAGGGGGGGGAGMAGDIWDAIDLPTYDFLANAVSSRTDEIIEKIKEFLGLQEPIQSFFDFMSTNLGTITGLLGGLATMGIGKTIMQFLSKIGFYGEAGLTAGGFIGTLMSIFGEFEFAWGFIEQITNEATWKTFLEMFGGGALGIGGAAIASNPLATMFLAALDGLAMFSAGLYDAAKNGQNLINVLEILVGGTAGGAGTGGLIGFFTAEAGAAIKGAEVGGGWGAAIGAAIGVLTNLSIYIAQNWPEISKQLEEVTGGIRDFTSSMGESFDLSGSATGFVEGMFNAYRWALDAIPKAFSAVMNFNFGRVNEMPAALKQAGEEMAESIDSFVESVFTPLREYDFSQLGYDVGNSLGNVFRTAIEFVVSDVPNALKSLWDTISKEGTEFIKTDVPNFFSNMWNIMQPYIQEMPDVVFGFLDAIWSSFWNIGKSVFNWIGEGFMTSLESLWEFGTGFFQGLWASFEGTRFYEIGTNIVESIKSGITNSGVVIWFQTNVIQPIQGFFGSLEITIPEPVNRAIFSLKQALAPVKEYLQSPFTNAFKEVKKIWEGLPQWFSNLWNGFLKTLGLDNIFKVGKQIAQDLKSGLNSIEMPKFHVTWEEKSSSFLNAFGALQWLKIKVPKLSFYAQGGMPDTGELYMARENGISEMVGRIGNRAAVANNDQIVTAVTQGVASANETEVALLREQNNLLTQLLAKDSTAIISTNDIVNGMSRMNKRAGKTIVATGV